MVLDMEKDDLIVDGMGEDEVLERPGESIQALVALIDSDQELAGGDCRRRKGAAIGDISSRSRSRSRSRRCVSRFGHGGSF
jgi:hypothetical protein